MNNFSELAKKIKIRNAKIAVIGMGYVGLPLAIQFAKAGFCVNGYDKMKDKVNKIKKGRSGIGFDKELHKVLLSKKFFVDIVTSKNIQDNDIYIICVPTPITQKKSPDLSSIQDIAKLLSKVNLTNKLIINESTVAPFTTNNLFGSLGKSYFLACSPERIDPGSNKTVERIPKIIGGINLESLKLSMSLYKTIIRTKLVAVKNMEIAEMSKMLENTYRAVNIGLINEFAILADSLDIDILDVIDSAKTKWSFQTHYPGIGVGGHCIPVDPYYILELAQQRDIPMKITQNGLQTNEIMPAYIAKKIAMHYKKGLRVLIYGLTYKKNVADLRESPVLSLCKILQKNKTTFSVYDPLLDKKTLSNLGYPSGKLKNADILIVGTDHKEFRNDYKKLIGENTIVIDGRNYFKKKIGKMVIGVGRTIS